MHDDNKIFQGRYEPIEDGKLVHFKKMHEDEGHFFITKVILVLMHIA